MFQGFRFSAVSSSFDDLFMIMDKCDKYKYSKLLFVKNELFSEESLAVATLS